MGNDNALRVKVLAETGEVSPELQKLVGNLNNVGKAALDAAGKSKNEWAEFGRQLTAIDPALEGVDQAMMKVASTADRMGRAGAAGNLGQMEKATIDAGVALAVLKERFAAVEAVTGEVTPAMTTFLTVSQAGFDASKAKLEALRAVYQGVRDDVTGVGKAVATTAGSMAKLDAATSDSWKEFSQLGAEGKAAAVALGAIDKAADSPRALQTAAARAKVELEGLVAKLKETGQPIPPALADSLKRAEAAISGAAAKSAALRDSNRDLKQSADVAALGMEGLAGSLGSVGGILSQLKAQGGGGIAESIGLGGLALTALTVGLSFVIEKLKAADQEAKSVGFDLAQLGEKGIGGILLPAMAAYERAMARAGFETSEFGKEIISGDDATKKYGDHMIGLLDPINKVAAAHNLWQQRMAELEQTAKRLGVTWKDAAAEDQKLANDIKLANAITEASTKTYGGLEAAIRNNTELYLRLGTEIDKGRAKLSDFNAVTQSAILGAKAQAAAMKEITEAHAKVPPSMQAVGTAAGILAKDLEKAAEQGETEFALMAVETSSALKKMVEDMRARGMEIPPIFQKAEEAAKAMATKMQEHLLKVPASAQEVAVAADRMAGELTAAADKGEKAFSLMALENAAAIKKMVEDMKARGAEVPAIFEKAEEAARLMATKMQEHLLKVPPTTKEVTVSMDRMVEELKVAATKGETAFGLMASENAAAIQKMVEELRARGAEIPPIFEKAEEAARLMATKMQEHLLKVPPTAKEVTASMDRMATELADAASRGEKAFGLFALENSSAISRMVEELKRRGMEIPPIFERAAEASGAALMKFPPTMEQVNAAARGMAKVLEDAGAKGTGAFRAMAVENAASIKQMVAELKARGAEIPPIFERALEAVQRFGDGMKEGLLKIPASMKDVEAAGQEMAQGLERAGSAGSDAFRAMAVENVNAIQSQIESMKLWGISVPQTLQDALKVAEEFRGALGGITGSMQQLGEATDRVRTPLQGQYGDMLKLNDAVNEWRLANGQAAISLEHMGDQLSRHEGTLIGDASKQRDLSAAVRENDGSFEGLLDTLTRISGSFNITTVEVQDLITNLERAGTQGLGAFLNNTKSTLDVMFTYFNQFNNNTTQSIMDEQTLLSQAIDKFRQEQKQKAIDTARELLVETREMLKKATEEALAERGPLGPGQAGSVSVDANGNWVNRPGSGGGMGLWPGKTNADLVRSLGSQYPGGRT